MTSLAIRLADRLLCVGDDLPLDRLAIASDRLHSATRLPAWAAEAASAPGAGLPRPVAPRLRAAGDHLEHAAGALLATREALGAYLISIGLPRHGVPPAEPDRHAAPAPAPPPRPATAATPPGRLGDVWADRVDKLADRVGAPRRAGEPPPSSAALLSRTAEAALAGDRDRLRSELIAADASVGLGLAAVGPAELRRLAAQVVGHPPRPEDISAVRAAALPRVAGLLPGLPARVANELLARVCLAEPVGGPAADPAGGPAADPHHPVDAAVACPVLVAGLLAATRHAAPTHPGAATRHAAPTHPGAATRHGTPTHPGAATHPGAPTHAGAEAVALGRSG